MVTESCTVRSLISKSHLRTNLHLHGFLSQILHQLDMISELNLSTTSGFLNSFNVATSTPAEIKVWVDASMVLR